MKDHFTDMASVADEIVPLNIHPLLGTNEDQTAEDLTMKKSQSLKIFVEGDTDKKIVEAILKAANLYNEQICRVVAK